jgi:hypothetical protein
MLEESGYVYSLDRMVYVNRNARKVFSEEFVEDHNEDELQERISERTEGQTWRFYTNSPVSEGVRRELETLLG